MLLFSDLSNSFIIELQFYGIEFLTQPHVRTLCRNARLSSSLPLYSSIHNYYHLYLHTLLCKIIIIFMLHSPLGLELLVQNLSRLDESNDEDAQGVNSSMGCIENLIEIRPDIALLICERTHILKFLLLRLKVIISYTYLIDF